MRECTSVDKVFQSNTPTLASINRDYGEAFLVDYVSIWLIGLNDRLNSNNKMTDEQIKITAHDVIDEFYTLTVADINLIFSRARKQKLYNRLDPFVILEWFSDYFDERCDVAMSASQSEHHYLKNNADSSELLRKESSKILKI